MSYKANDLELRTAQGAGAGRSHTLSSGPIEVDDLVLACCNAAYDAARFHASPDVRLEHLLHALTRVPAAADLLTALGIRADHLRRETAIAIAAAMPAGSLERAGAPTSSAALEDVLRRAADLAAGRRAPASVHDVLRILLWGGPESPAALLLTRAATDPQQLQRWRDEVRREAFTTQPSDHEARARQMSPDAADALCERLDKMEAALRTLGSEVAGDRKTIIDSLLVVQSDLQGLRAAAAHALSGNQAQAIVESVREVQADLHSLRGERGQGLPTAAMDAALDAKLGAIGDSLSGLGARLAPIEKLAGDETWLPLLEKVEAIEGLLGDHNSDVAKKLAITLSETVSNALSARLDQVETALQRLHGEVAQVSGTVGERQIGLDASVRAHLQGTEEASKAHERDLGEIYEALVKLGTNQQTLGDNLNTWRLESSGDVGIISNRLQQLELTSADLLSRFAALTNSAGTSEEEAPRRSNGFKRWLYGTSSVLAGSWRQEAGSIRQAFSRSRPGEKS